MSNNLTNITYGSYDFQRDGGPVPLLNINKEFLHSADGTKIGSVFRVTLQGELNKIPSGVEGYKNIDTMQDLLCSGFNEDCKEFKVVCGGNILIQQYPRVNSITFSPTPDNWAQTSDFTIELEWDGENFSGYNLRSVNESWDLQLDNRVSFYDMTLPGATGDNNMHLFTLTHSIGAQGVTPCTGPNSGNPGWKEARNFVVTQLGYSLEDIQGSGVFNLSSSLSGWNHSRVQRIGEHEGTFSVNETWLVADTGLQNNCGNAIEDFTANVSFDSSNGLTTVAVNGSIEGIEQISYGSNPGDYTVVQNKYDNASGFWDCVKPKLPGRASLVGNVNINPQVLSSNVGHNPTRGIINYSYTYNNRPCNFITGSLLENITVSDDNPTDVFAEIMILGRSFGPILQDINTVTSNRRTVNISAIMGPTTQCSDLVAAINSKPDITSLLCTLQSDISGANIKMFKSQDQESWDIKTGQYNRTVQWTWNQCSGTPPNTSFC